MASQPSLSVIIVSYNRPQLLSRAFASIFSVIDSPDEVVIVDNASDFDVAIYQSDRVKVVSNERNYGPSVARNIGLGKATSDYAVLLDDDDYFIEGYTEEINSLIEKYLDYPVVMFPRSNGTVKNEMSREILGINDYVSGRVSGDFTHVIKIDAFKYYGFKFPEFFHGGESLLWWEVAKMLGIPTSSSIIQNLGNEAASRITSIDERKKNAEQIAKQKLQLLAHFGSFFDLNPISQIKCVGAILGYSALANRNIKELIGPNCRLTGRSRRLVVLGQGVPFRVRRLFFLWFSDI